MKRISKNDKKFNEWLVIQRMLKNLKNDQKFKECLKIESRFKKSKNIQKFNEWLVIQSKGIYNRLPLIMSYLLDIDLAL